MSQKVYDVVKDPTLNLTTSNGMEMCPQTKGRHWYGIKVDAPRGEIWVRIQEVANNPNVAYGEVQPREDDHDDISRFCKIVQSPDGRWKIEEQAVRSRILDVSRRARDLTWVI